MGAAMLGTLQGFPCHNCDMACSQHLDINSIQQSLWLEVLSDTEYMNTRDDTIHAEQIQRAWTIISISQAVGPNRASSLDPT